MSENYRDYECPLCHFKAASLFFSGGQRSGYRDFLHCSSCDLIFVPPKFFLSEDEEKVQYLHHNNKVEDPDYRAFLGRLYNELKPRLPNGAKGLDYGAGPGPALVEMMREDGFNVFIYDPFFYPDKAPLSETYDFITCTETAEHFRNPSEEFDRLNAMLANGGWFGVMTGMLDNWSDFPEWYYHRDPTHVCFYSRKTMLWIAQKYSWSVEFPRPNVMLARKTIKNRSVERGG